MADSAQTSIKRRAYRGQTQITNNDMNDISLSLNLPATALPRVAIVGCGFGGLAAAQSLAGKGFQVVVFDKNNYHTFQPLLYQVASAGLEADSIAYPIRKIFAKKKDVLFRWTEVKKIDLASKTIQTSLGNCKYDYLIVATGATTNFFGNEILEKNAMPMKSVVEALDLRSLLLQNLEQATLTSDTISKQALMTFAVVGGGPTGIELAGALCELKNHVLPHDYPELDFKQMKVLLIESGKEILQNMQLKNQAKAKKYLVELGTEILLETRVQNYDGVEIKTANDTTLPCAAMIWAAGIKGMSIEGIDSSLLTASKRVKTNPHCQLDTAKEIYVIGDLNYLDSTDFPRGYPQVAPLAVQQGKYVATHILNTLAKKETKPFTYIDKGSMATIGRNRAVVESGKVQFGGWLGWMAWMTVHLMLLVGFRNRVVVFINWLWNYINYDRNIRLIIRPFSKEKN
jgi:NADH dehydrogenase